MADSSTFINECEENPSNARMARSDPLNGALPGFEDAVSTPLNTLRIGFYTARHLEPEQLVWMTRRKLHSVVMPRLPVDWHQRYERRIPDDLNTNLLSVQSNNHRLRSSLNPRHRADLRERAERASKGHLRMLGHTKCVSFDDDFPSQSEDVPFLWWLKMYSFEPLAWVVQGVDPASELAAEIAPLFLRWIDNWIESVPLGESAYLRRRWTPWAVSRRIQHWLQFLAWMDEIPAAKWDELSRTRFERAIYTNAAFLANHIEWDVGGNHLIDNAAGLVIAGISFDSHGTEWLETGLSIFERICHRQFLSDGCHFERSPMYHAVALYNLVTIIDLLTFSGHDIPQHLRQTAIRATEFLVYLQGPAGPLPLLNDSVRGQSLPVDCLIEYACEVLDHEIQPISVPTRIPTADHAGYHWLSNMGGSLLIDAGPICPPHLPGHAHSDLLNILLWVGETPIVTDTGTYSYVAGNRRQFARSVRGHNTVQVGAIEPVPIAGKYLMGPRPTPSSRRCSGKITLFESMYDVKGREDFAYTHHRGIFTGDSWWFIRDLISGSHDMPVTSRFHLHPNVNVDHDKTTNHLRLSSDNSGEECWFYYQPSDDISIEDGWYYPRFGQEIPRDILTITQVEQHGTMVCLDYLFSTVKYDPALINVDDTGAEVNELLLGSERISLPPYRLRQNSSES